MSDRKVRAAIEAGARDIVEIGTRTGAGTVCQDCHAAIEELLRAGREPDRPADLSAGRGTKSHANDPDGKGTST